MAVSASMTIKAQNRAPKVVEVASGASVSIAKTDSNVVFYNADSVSSLTVILPAASELIPGKHLNLGFATSVASLIFQPGSGNSFLVSPPTSVNINGIIAFTLDANNRWCFV